MKWSEARDRTLATWRDIRHRIAAADPDQVTTLITDLNAASEICNRARSEAIDPRQRCDFCVVFDGAEPCLDLRFKLTESLLEKDWDKARALSDEVIARLENASLPAD